MKLFIKGKIILIISTIIIVTLFIVTIVISIQSSVWFHDEAKDRLDTAANIILSDINNRFSSQIKSIDSIAKDDNVISPASLVRDMLIENPDEVFDDAYAEMTKELSIRLKRMSSLEGFDLLTFYDENGNLIAFYRNEDKLAAWLVGNKCFVGNMDEKEPVNIDVPREIELKYSGEVRKTTYKEYNIYSNSISIHTCNPVCESVEGVEKIVGVITATTLLDDEYAKKKSQLTNTKINFFVDKNFSAGTLKGFKKISDKNYAEILNKYNASAGRLQTGNLFVEIESKIGDEGYYQKLYPFTKADKIIGVMAVLYPKKFVESKIRNIIELLAIITPISSIIGIIIAMFSFNAITNPLKKAVSVSNRLAEGDLTVDIEVKRQDETGQLLTAIKNMVESLKKIVRKVYDVTVNLSSSAVEISSAIEQQVAIATEQSASLTEISSTMEELSASSTQIAENSESVVQIAAESLQKTKNGTIAVERVVMQMDEIRKDNQESIKEIVQLGNKSKEIGKVMEIINNIADQTKLIAFNAALEASSAGEAGKRFGVVASEIRRLADNVMESTGDIENKINEIQEAVNHLVIASEKGSKKIEEGMESSSQTVDILKDILVGAQSTTNAAKQISLSTQQQKTASEQVVISLKDIKVGAEQTAEGVKQTLSITEDLTGLSTDLICLVENFKLNDIEEDKEIEGLRD